MMVIRYNLTLICIWLYIRIITQDNDVGEPELIASFADDIMNQYLDKLELDYNSNKKAIVVRKTNSLKLNYVDSQRFVEYFIE